MKKYIQIAAALAAVILCGCTKVESTHTIGGGDEYDLTGCTALYTGNSSALGYTAEGITMYKTATANEYYIPKFFGGDGELLFKWDKETGDISMEETGTGMISGFYPVIVVDQEVADKQYADNPQKSTYDAMNQLFTFNVVLESANERDEPYYIAQTVTFQITGSAASAQ